VGPRGAGYDAIVRQLEFRLPLSLALVGACLLLLAADAGAVVATPDTAATHDYLLARYEYTQALVAGASASIKSVTALEGQLAAECPGVLSGAPKEGPGEPTSSTARQSGERERSEQQLSTLREELDAGLHAASMSANLGAFQTFEAKVSPLQWSNPAVAALLHWDLAEASRRDARPAPEICPDMKAWAASSYHRLSPASAAFRTAEMQAGESAPAGSLSRFLEPYEDASDRALIASSKRLLLSLSKTYAASRAASQEHLMRTLGLPENIFEEQENGKLLGEGRTASGERFIVRLELPGPSGEHCRLPVDVEFRRSDGSGGGSGTCLTTRRTRVFPSGCSGEVTDMELGVPASVVRVRLTLRGGRRITSRVVHVSRRDGGPAGIYVQAVSGYRHYPLSLTELDRNGQIVRVVAFPAGQRCHREPDHIGPTFVGLVRGTAPGGEPFSITGTLVHFGRGQTDFSVGLEAGTRGGVADEGESESSESRRSFGTSLRTECVAHPFTAVYGILSPPGTSVFVLSAGSLVPLTKVTLAANLHAAGPLFYGVFATSPAELVVKRADGTTLYTESLVTRAREAVEFCEGYAEPAG